jgi:hypothetical protein
MGGQPRSGTSLLTSILRASPDLHQAFELHIRKPSFVVGNGGRYTRNIMGQLGLDGVAYDRIVADHEPDRPAMNLGAWVGPKEQVSAEQLTGRETENFESELAARARLVGGLMRGAATAAGKQRWGFKLLGDVIHAREYFAALPGATFVLLVRDPRDHALSVMELNRQRVERGQPLFYGSYRDVARDWKRTIADGRRALEESAIPHIVVRYEDLVRSPESELARLQAALDIDLSTALDFYKQDFIEAHVSRFKHHDNLKSPINSASVDKWKTKMSAEEASVFSEEAGDVMSLYGYEARPPGS